jgi:hypothetical protein
MQTIRECENSTIVESGGADPWVSIPLMYGQRLDPVSGICQPWYTAGALDVIQEWDVKDKIVLEWGGGMSTLWWASRVKHVFLVETNPKWIKLAPNVTLREISPDRTDVDCYEAVPEGCKPDIVIVDGSRRMECLKKALTLPRPLTIIFDNWQQDGVFIEPEAEALMEPFKQYGQFFVQADHKDHNGRPWQTAIWRLP